jgi:selenoprotein W-related protein
MIQSTTLLFHATLLLSSLSHCHAFADLRSSSSRLAGHRSHVREGASRLSASSDAYQITIEYCPGCRWGLRSFWMAQELLTTFQDDAALEAVTVVPLHPPAPSGSFVVKCYSGTSVSVLWDRKEQEGFPEMKELKQLVRDRIDPELYLGHSDRKDRQEEGEKDSDAQKLSERGGEDAAPVNLQGTISPSVAMTYCTGCRWLLRAAYLGMELMSTFDEEINSFSLIPSRPPAKGGKFAVTLDGEVIWDRVENGGFPPVPQLKQLVRDRIDPAKDLGHSDAKKDGENPEISEQDEDQSEEAEEARNFFGVA